MLTVPPFLAGAELELEELLELDDPHAATATVETRATSTVTKDRA
jgi:hypothetical protein